MQGQMRAYIFKRLLLMIPTILGVLTLTFAVVQFVPGGPVEQMVLELKGKGSAVTGGSESSGFHGQGNLLTKSSHFAI